MGDEQGEWYSLWEGEESGITLIQGLEPLRREVGFDAVKVAEFRARDLEEAIIKRDQHYGWKTHAKGESDHQGG